MKVIVNGERELINVANWVYTKNKWVYTQTRIIINNVGDISYTQLISGNVHLRFPCIGKYRTLTCMAIPSRGGSRISPGFVLRRLGRLV